MPEHICLLRSLCTSPFLASMCLASGSSPQWCAPCCFIGASCRGPTASVSAYSHFEPFPLQIFIFMTGVFVSSWMGTAALSLGEWIIKKLPLVKHVYSAAKQVTAGLNPENENAKSFRECVLIRHPRHGEYAFGFITGETILQVGAQLSAAVCWAPSFHPRMPESTLPLQMPQGESKLYSVYVPTNHVYVGDIFLLTSEDIIKPNLSVREGLEIVVSVGTVLLGSDLVSSCV